MSEVANIPQLRFPEFSGEWEDGKLGNYGNLINGLTYSLDNIVDDGLLVLRSSNVQNGQIYLNDNVYVNLDVDDAVLTREDDILICVRNGSKRLIGKSTIINKNLPKSTHGAFMTVFRGESNKFISHWFHSSIYYKEVHKNLGATINSINGSNLKKFKTIFPLKPEQQKIAAFLTAIDNKIEQLSKKQELLGEYKKGVMQKIFSQAIRFKADDGSRFPDWEEKKLGDVGSFKSGTGFTEAEQGGESGVPFFKVSDMNLEGNQKVMVSANNYVNDEQIARLNYKPIDKKSVIFAKVGAAVFLERKRIADNFLIDNNMMAFTPTEDIDFFRQWFDTVRLSKYAQVGALPSYNASDLKTIKLNLPTKPEQTKIANFLSSIDNKIEQVGKQLDQSKQFKKALLQQMFV